MPRIIIDDIPVEVPEGVNILEAARSVGITIPHFCWHPALGKAGACRACAVKIVDGPAKGLQMSCMLPAQDGMVVSTTDGEAVALRRAVIEWLMINHPHDCPVCDEGGECQLQDYTIAGGHGIRRYDGLKRTHANQYLGQYIEHEMNRCIQCYRCARFYQEEGELESPFSGNLADICPTGVFTDKTARYRARYWDYDMAPSVCPHCSLGCNTVPMARYRELLKVTARRNDAVNGWFICDRGRFSNAAVNAPDRPRQALVDGRPVTLEEALDAVSGRLLEFIRLHGPEALAIVGSPRMPHEGNTMAARLRDALGAGALCYFDDALRADRTIAAVSRLHAENSASQEDVRRADLIVVVESTILDEAPMMALAVRQAWRAGARVYMIGEGSPPDPALQALFDVEKIMSLADARLAEAKRAVVICGTRNRRGDIIRAVAGSGAKLAVILDGPDAFGCAELSVKYGAVSCSEAIASGKIKGLITFESDIPLSVVEGVTLLATADWQATELVRQGGIVLPVTSWIEMEGTFVNNEGRAQLFSQVMNPGLPIMGADPAEHPPREHGKSAPGGDVLPSWDLITRLIRRCSGEQGGALLQESNGIS